MTRSNQADNQGRTARRIVASVVTARRLAADLREIELDRGDDLREYLADLRGKLGRTDRTADYD